MSDAIQPAAQLLQEISSLRAQVTQLQDWKSEHLQKQEREKLYHHMVEHSLGLICTHDFDGNLLYVNPAAAQALGYPPDAWVAKNLRDFLAPEFQALFDLYLARIRQQRTDQGLVRVVTSTGEKRIWRYHNIWYEEDGRPLYVIGCAQDVTEQVRLERALRRAHDELEARVQERTVELVQVNAALRESERRYRELFDNANAETADRAKSELLATMTHELRTPLNVVTGYIDLLLEKEFGPLTNKQIEILQRVHKNARGLFDLISDVLDLNRLEAGRLPVERKEVQVPQLFREIETETQGLRDLSELTFVWNVESGVPVLSTDPGKVKVVIKNLLNNAIKFTKAGSVTVEARQVNKGVEISVTDTGVGIPVEQQTLIFEAFRQGNAPLVRRQKGVGLGLHIAKQLLDMLSGTIHVESKVGHGTTFRVWLPASEWRGGRDQKAPFA